MTHFKSLIILIVSFFPLNLALLNQDQNPANPGLCHLNIISNIKYPFYLHLQRTQRQEFAHTLQQVVWGGSENICERCAWIGLELNVVGERGKSRPSFVCRSTHRLKNLGVIWELDSKLRH